MNQAGGAQFARAHELRDAGLIEAAALVCQGMAVATGHADAMIAA